MLTCEECGKINGQDDVGTHWICMDCKADSLPQEEKPSPYRLDEKNTDKQ
jgi:hypothetical protein